MGWTPGIGNALFKMGIRIPRYVIADLISTGINVIIDIDCLMSLAGYIIGSSECIVMSVL